MLSIDEFKRVDSIAKGVADFWQQQNSGRIDQLEIWDEIRRYTYATDTQFTTAQTSPWRNSTTQNKVAWIYDTLMTHLVRALIPNDRFFRWKADGIQQEKQARLIELYNLRKTRHRLVNLRPTIQLAMADYITTGNTFMSVEYVKYFRRDYKTGERKLVFKGARPVRISPQSVCMDSAAPTYEKSPLAVRSILTKADFFANESEYLNMASDEQDQEDIRATMQKVEEMHFMNTELQDWIKKNHIWQDGSDFVDMVARGDVELIEFFGNVYDQDEAKYYYNRHVIIANRYFVLVNREVNTLSGEKPIKFGGWRKRTDNLWCQGPLDNIIGLQYRADHLENLKADMMDVFAWPIMVAIGEGIAEEDIEYKPGGRYVLPPDASLDLLHPDPRALQYDQQIVQIHQVMEELASVPRETAGFRTPGEKTKYEVSQLLQSADGGFEDKLLQFENEVLEPVLNLMFELNLQNIDEQEFREIFPPEIGGVFEKAGVEDLMAHGRLYPIGSKHYKLRQQKVQQILEFLQVIAQMPDMVQHISPYQTVATIARELGVDEEGIVQFGGALQERTQLQQMMQQLQAGGPQGGQQARA